MATVESRVARVAEALLAEQQFVTPIDVLIGLGWLAQSNVDRWMKGRIISLDLCIGVDETKTASALHTLRLWAQAHELQGWQTEYRELRFITSGGPASEGAFRTRWAMADSPAPEPPPQRSRELTVVSPHGAWSCCSCGDTGDLLVKTSVGTLCLECADLGHLVFYRRAMRPSPAAQRS